MINNIDTALDAGFCKPLNSLKLNDKEEFIHAICLHHTILKTKAELDQMIEGLKNVGVLDYIQKYPILMEPFFTSNEKDISAGKRFHTFYKKVMLCNISDELKVLLKDIRFSTRGSSQREKEEATFMLFMDLLYECEGK